MKNKKTLKYFIPVIIAATLILIVSVSLLFITKKDELTNNVKEQDEQVIRIEEQEATNIPRMNFLGNVLNLKTKQESEYINIEYTINNEKIFESYATIKLQGTSSLNYTKKNYTITFYTDDTFSKKNNIDLNFGWGEQNKYCLKANWIDSTHARNIVSARLMGKVQARYGLFEDCPNNGLIDGYPIEIYINGIYQGLYTCNIPKGDWMFNMDTNNPNHIVMCGENNNFGSSVTFYNESLPIDGQDWSIEVGPNETQEEINETFEKLNRVIRFVKDSSDEEFKQNFDQYLNLDSCLNYLCFLYLGNCTDNVTKNMLLVTYDGEVWYPSMYDLDSTWGLKYDGITLYKETNKFPEEYADAQSLLWNRILACFSEEFKTRYNVLRQTVLSNKNIIYEFENFSNSIPKEAWNREHEKWQSIPSISYGIDQIINYLTIRSKYVDYEINTL
ncbi:MAG: CotH kinase family protein [Clostridia bacterium]